MAANRNWVMLGGVLLLAVSACTDLGGERFAVSQTEDGMLEFVACADSLPAIAVVWRVGPNKIVGDDDDEAVWGPGDDWTEDTATAARLVVLVTSIAWEPGLFASVEADTNPTRELTAPLGPDEVLNLDGSVNSRQEFASNCDS